MSDPARGAAAAPPTATPPGPPPGRCPHCGSEAIQIFEDSSGRCQTCGQPFRGRGHLQESGGAVAGLAQDTAGTSPAAEDAFHSSKLLVGALAAFGGVILVLAVPLGAVLSASLSGIAVESRFASLFSSYRAIPFCFLAVAITAAGFYTIFVGYRHAVGEIPLGTTLVVLGIAGMATCAAMLFLVGSMVAVVGGIGGGLLLAAGALDNRLG